MSELTRVVNSLDITYFKSSSRTVIKPVLLNGIIEKYDIIVRLVKGNLFVGKNHTKIKEGQYVFFPSSKEIQVGHGKYEELQEILAPGFPDMETRVEFVPDIESGTEISSLSEIFTIAGFQVKIYGSVPFFSLMDIPYAVFDSDPVLDMHFKMLNDEEADQESGRKRMLDSLAEGFFIRIFRLLENHPEFGSEFQKIETLLDKRLVNIVTYIRTNLEKDLSNKAVASVAFVSEDYVGQLFKSLTNRNLQEFIEFERLESAYRMLVSGSESVQEIAHKVGFKDPAYFSRRFKLRFGENANSIRRKDQFVI